MRIVMFYHSLISDWNHGNAHFLRGVVSELLARGHEVEVFEPRDAWSMTNLLEDQGDSPIEEFYDVYSNLSSQQYDLDTLDLDEALDDADLVIVHEWNDTELVNRVGKHRSMAQNYKLLFHDTHHRMVTQPSDMAHFDLSHYDGVLAFGQIIADLYIDRGLAQRAWVWHEAADTRVFKPRHTEKKSGDVVWVGNWGDEERSSEIFEYFIDPVDRLKLKARVHGVRYPDSALEKLYRANIAFGGWVPNFRTPEIYSDYYFTVHVPRGPYARNIPGVPTIRVFEALACGIPLLSAPWDDSEGLFRPGRDFLLARNSYEMRRHMRDIVGDPDLRDHLIQSGLETIQKRHTCTHRVNELLKFYEHLNTQEELAWLA